MLSQLLLSTILCPDTQEDGFSLEGLIDQDTVEVSESQIEPYSNQDFVIDKKSTIA